MEFALAACGLRLDNSVFEAAEISTSLCCIDQPRVYHSPRSCGCWWLDLLHAQDRSIDAMAAVVLPRLRRSLVLISRQRRGRVRALALDSEVAFGHRDICIGMPAGIVPIGCLDGLSLIPVQGLSAAA